MMTFSPRITVTSVHVDYKSKKLFANVPPKKKIGTKKSQRALHVPGAPQMNRQQQMFIHFPRLMNAADPISVIDPRNAPSTCEKEKWKFNWGKFTGSLQSWTRVAALLNEPRSIQKKLNDLNLFELIKYPLKLKYETSDISSGAQCQLFKSLHQPKQSAKKTIKKGEKLFL